MIHERDGRTHKQTDTQTPHDDLGRAYTSHCAEKICNENTASAGSLAGSKRFFIV